MTSALPEAVPALVICARVDDPGLRRIPGSEIHSCCKCGLSVAVSPATLARPEMAVPGTQIVCVECADPDGVELRGPTEEQRAELAAAGFDGDAWPLKELWGEKIQRGPRSE